MNAYTNHRWWEAGDTVLVATSGGVDSMVLLALCLKWAEKKSLEVCCAHVNYKLRGAESDKQEQLVRQFAKKNHISVYGTEAKLKNDRNFQEEAREFRHCFLRKIAKKESATHILLGHHLEDQAETILDHLLRGSGIHGLAGMRKKQKRGDYYWVRPLLDFKKEEILKYAEEEDIPFLEDSSNHSPKYKRNRIRMELLPLMKEITNNSEEQIAHLAETLQAVSDYMETLVLELLLRTSKNNKGRLTFKTADLIHYPKAVRAELLRQSVIRLTGSAKGLKKDHFEKMEHILFATHPKGTYFLPNKVQFVREGERLHFRAIKPNIV